MKPKITPSNIKAFIEGYTKLAFDGLIGLPTHLQEQIVYRASKCPDCVKAKECKHCGCSVPGKFYVTKSCNKGERFPDLMEKDEWETYKKSIGWRPPTDY